MTLPDNAEGVRCPVCLSRVSLDFDKLWEWVDGRHQPLDIPEQATEEQRARRLRRAQVRCPNLGQDFPEHFLPYQYVDSDPVVIGLIGASMSGKTHLLASMIAAVQDDGLDRYGLSVTPLDIARYERFINTKVRPLFERGEVLARTSDNVWEFEVGLMVSDRDGPPSAPQRAVAFFDVSGGELSALSPAERRVFLDAVDAFVFVVDADQLDGGVPDAAFSTILSLVQNKQDKAALLILTKADRFRFGYPVDRWLRDGPPSPDLDAAEIEAESREIYTFVERYDKAGGWLRPYFEFGRSAMHAASATGGPCAPGQRHFARPVRPQRVLRSFLTLMALTGVIDSDEARKVGR
ncbi:hypothetical protein GCM10009799_09290 [Nocardiopsis rhodophaea]|uniref:Uncharacterized protein n=1 Tax=Nocardiopsis rhodophaea TaxID=280238 RepID=A0ABN2SFS3_9ACTN